jgi:hypothetical protein
MGLQLGNFFPAPGSILIPSGFTQCIPKVIPGGNVCCIEFDGAQVVPDCSRIVPARKTSVAVFLEIEKRVRLCRHGMIIRSYPSGTGV